MNQDKVAMPPSSEITDAERRRRLGQVYRILLEAGCKARQKQATERSELADPDRSAASDAPAVRPETQGKF